MLKSEIINFFVILDLGRIFYKKFLKSHLKNFMFLLGTVPHFTGTVPN